MKFRHLLQTLALAFAFFAISCASSPKPYDDNLSNLPQNRPQAWEGQAAMGGMFSTP